MESIIEIIHQFIQKDTTSVALPIIATDIIGYPTNEGSTMVPTNAASTQLSAEKIALLLQGLLDVKTEEDAGKYSLHEDVDKLVCNLLKAQEAFVKGIDALCFHAYKNVPILHRTIKNCSTVGQSVKSSISFHTQCCCGTKIIVFLFT